jgi:hypothetical protein
MYSKPDQSGFALSEHETVVKLDTGDLVAVTVEGFVEPHSGNPVVGISARVVNEAGNAVLDANGQPIRSAFRHASNHHEVEAVGGIDALRRILVMAVLGEDTAPLFKDPIHATVLEHYSIRTNLASALHAGIVKDVATLL